jgi:hypothetical protein
VRKILYVICAIGGQTPAWAGAKPSFQKDSHQAEFERMSDEEMIKAIEERAKQTRDQFAL